MQYYDFFTVLYLMLAKLVEETVRYQVRHCIAHKKATPRVIALWCQQREGQHYVGSMGLAAPSLGVVDVDVPQDGG